MTVEVATEILQRWGAAVRARRLRMALTQEELAAAAGCDQRTISDVEKGKHQLPLARALAIAAALDTSYADLFDVPADVTP